jgi:ATP-binding cassette subfamily B multidrug efflux pump
MTKPPPTPLATQTRAERLLKEFHQEQTAAPAMDWALLGRLLPYMRAHGTLFIAALVLIPLTSLSQLYQPFLLKKAIDAAVVDRSPSLLGTVVAVFAGVVLFEFLTRFGQIYAMQLAGQRAMADLRRAVFAHTQRTRVSYYDRTPIGRVLTRVTNDIDSIGEMFSSGAVTAIADVLLLIGILGFMLYLDWRLSLVAFAALPPLALAVEVIRRYARAAFAAIRLHVAHLNAYLSEQVQGIETVQAFGREAVSAADYDVINAAHRDANYESIKYDAILYSVVESVSAFSVAMVIWYAGVRAGVIEDTPQSAAYIGTVVAFFEYIQRFFVPIRDLSTKYTMIQSGLASAERIFQFLDHTDLETDTAAVQGTGVRAGVVPARAVDHASTPPTSLAFEHVSFGYRGTDQVLRDVSFTVKPGERIAIVGATGAGKSTVISLLLRLYEIGQGRIRVGGRDIQDMPRADLRRLFSVVTQDVFLFSGTVAQNVALDAAALDEAKVTDALRRVGALDMLNRREGGIHARVDERGANFSAGERQLISFARALYRNAPMLILDEATANIDSDTESKLQAAIDELMRGRTAISIAHRLSTIRKSDRILVFHKGQVAEQGTHDELLSHGGIYAKLHKLQFKELAAAE